MPLPVTLNTNEVKDALGAEVEFQHYDNPPRGVIYHQSGELPGIPYRLKISHQESGSGTSRRRRSVCRFDKTEQGAIDNTKVITTSFYLVGDIPVGNLATYGSPKDLLANLISFVASKGASTTILYDCTGYGADSILNGTL